MTKTPQAPSLKTLSPPAKRAPAHRRTITLDGYARDDGAYDIEAELIDTKAHSFPSRAHGEIKKDQPLHHMRVRATISEEMEILAAEAVTIAGPYHREFGGRDHPPGLEENRGTRDWRCTRLYPYH